MKKTRRFTLRKTNFSAKSAKNDVKWEKSGGGETPPHPPKHPPSEGAKRPTKEGPSPPLFPLSRGAKPLQRQPSRPSPSPLSGPFGASEGLGEGLERPSLAGFRPFCAKMRQVNAKRDNNGYLYPLLAVYFVFYSAQTAISEGNPAKTYKRWACEPFGEVFARSFSFLARTLRADR